MGRSIQGDCPKGVVFFYLYTLNIKTMRYQTGGRYGPRGRFRSNLVRSTSPYGGFSLPTSAGYISTYQGLPIAETEKLGESLTQKYYKGLEEYAKLNTMMDQLQVLDPDKPIVQDIKKEVSGLFDTIVERGDYESAMPNIIQATSRITGDRDLQTAMHYKKKYDKWSEDLMKKDKLLDYQKQLARDKFKGYKGVRQGHDVSSYLYTPSEAFDIDSALKKAIDAINPRETEIVRSDEYGNKYAQRIKGIPREDAEAMISSTLFENPAFLQTYNEMKEAFGNEAAAQMVEDKMQGYLEAAVDQTISARQYLPTEKASSSRATGSGRAADADEIVFRQDTIPQMSKGLSLPDKISNNMLQIKKLSEDLAGGVYGDKSPEEMTQMIDFLKRQKVDMENQYEQFIESTGYDIRNEYDKLVQESPSVAKMQYELFRDIMIKGDPQGMLTGYDITLDGQNVSDLFEEIPWTVRAKVSDAKWKLENKLKDVVENEKQKTQVIHTISDKENTRKTKMLRDGDLFGNTSDWQNNTVISRNYLEEFFNGQLPDEYEDESSRQFDITKSDLDMTTAVDEVTGRKIYKINPKDKSGAPMDVKNPMFIQFSDDPAGGLVTDIESKETISRISDKILNLSKRSKNDAFVKQELDMAEASYKALQWDAVIASRNDLLVDGSSISFGNLPSEPGIEVIVTTNKQTSPPQYIITLDDGQNKVSMSKPANSKNELSEKLSKIDLKNMKENALR